MVSSYTGISPVEKIGKEAYYLCVAKDREDLLGELNIALSIITEQDTLDVDGLIRNIRQNRQSQYSCQKKSGTGWQGTIQ